MIAWHPGRLNSLSSRARVYAKKSPKNYTYPALSGVTRCCLGGINMNGLRSKPFTNDGLTRHGMPVLSARHFSFQQDSFHYPQDSFYYQQVNFRVPQGIFYYLLRKSLLQTF